MVNRRSFCLTLLAATAMPWQSVAAAASPTEVAAARGFVKGLATQAVEVLCSTENDAASRRAAFHQLLSTGFNVPFIGRFSLGRHWHGATAEQRERYLALFTDFLVESFTRRLSGFSCEAFQITGARPVGRKDVIVQSRIARSGGASIKADWRVRGFDGTYKVVDVSVEGVSMVVTQRTKFTSVVRRQGMDGLLQALRVQTRTHLVANAS